MDRNRSTSIATVLAASIIMATILNDQDSTARMLLLWWKWWSKREDFKRNSQSIITLLAYIGQWIQDVICACISICCNCTKHFLHTKISTVHVTGTGLLSIMYKGNEKDFQFKWKDTFLPHSQYAHPIIPPCYWTLFCSTQLYKQILIQISHLLLSSTDFMKF